MPANLSVTRATTPFQDRNGNGIQDPGEPSYGGGEANVVDPGDVLYTRVTITNSGDTVLTAVTFSDSFTGTTLLSGSVNVSPIAFSDAFTAVGNTVLRVGGAGNIGSGPSSVVAGNLLSNDLGSALNGVGIIIGDDFPGFDIVTVSNGTSAGGGSFNIFADGSFNYVNQAGDTGTDTFTYTIRDRGYDGIAGNGDDLLSTATVTITLTGEVWYVDSAGGPGGTGTSNNPFASITALNTANLDGVGDTIYVKNAPTGAIVLDNGQRLIGEGADLSVASFTLATAGANSSLSANVNNGWAVTVGQNNTIAGLNIVATGTNAGGITDNEVAGFGTLNLNPAALNAATPGYQSTITASGAALSLSDGAVAGNGLSSTNSAGGASNVSLTDITGSLALGSGAMSGATGASINVVNTTGAAVNTGLTYGGSITQANNAAMLNVDGGTAGHSGTITLTGTKSATNGTGLNFENADGTYSVTGSTTLAGGNAGIDIVSNTAGNGGQGSGGTFTFGGSFTITSPTGAAIQISDSTASANIDIDVTQANGAAALEVTNHSGGTLTFQTTGSFNVTNGSGLQFTNADGTYAVSSANTLGGVDGGIDILAGSDAGAGSTGTFTFLSNTSINNTGSGAGLNLLGSDANVTFNGSITDNNGRAVSIDDHDAGTVTFTSQSSINGTGAGIHVLNSNGGDVNFNGQVTLSTGANTAITLTSNSGSTIDFAADDNGLDITTTTGRGIDANNGGTLTIADAGSGNTITSVGGIAFNAVGGTTFGSVGVTFDTISASGGTNGIVLSGTGAGGFTVLGDGGSLTQGGNGSGGNIQNMSGDGISLNNVQNVRLSDMIIQNNAGNGIGGTTVNGMVLDQLSIIDNGDSEATDDSGINLSQLTGTASGGLRPTAITNSNFTNNYEFEIQITNSSGTLTNLRFLNNNVTSNGATAVHGNMFNFLSLGTASMGLTVAGSTFDGNTVTGALTGTAVHVDASGGTINADVGTSTFIDNNAAVNMSTATTGNLTFNIHDNATMTGQRSTGINVFSNGNATGTINGTIANNTIGSNGVAGSGSDLGRGIQVSMEGGGTANLLITNNNVQQTEFEGISVVKSVAAGTVNATITNNNVHDIPTSRGIIVQTTIAGGILNTSITGNTLTTIGGQPGDPNATSMRINEQAGTLNVTQGAPGSGAGGVDTLNGLPAIKVAIGGSPQYNQPAPTLPSSPVLPMLAEALPPEAPVDHGLGNQPLVIVDDPAPAGGDSSSTADAAPSSPSPPSSPAGPIVVDDGIVSEAELALIVDAAIARWADAGATEAQLAAMRATPISIADLGGRQLGASGFGEITLDDDAGGWRWFVDATPGEDGEYRGSGSQLSARDDQPLAATRIDLLTVVMHELGHQIGLADSHAPGDRDALMFGTVRAGERRLPGDEDVTSGTGTPVTGAFAVSPINLGTLNPGMSVTIEFRSTVDPISEDRLVSYLLGQSQASSGALNFFSASENLAVDALTLGNRVFVDANKNNAFDGGDSGIAGVTLTLFADTNNNGVYDEGTDLHIGYTEVGGGAGYQAGIDTPTAPGTGTALTVTTDGSGFYSFAGLAPGDYIVRVNAANFGGVLAGKVVGASADDSNNNVDNDNNGQAFSGYVATRAIRLDYGLETVAGPTGPDNDTNDTLDIAFELPNQPPAIANLQGNAVTFTEGDAAVNIDALGDAAVSDSDSTNYNGGSLTVSITGGKVAAQDQLGVDGTVTISAGTVSVGATPIGTVTGGGAGGGDLVFTFNTADADDARVQTLVRALTYTNSDAVAPTGGARTISLTLVDGGGEGNGGDDDSIVTATVNVVSINDEPAGGDDSAVISEDQVYIFTIADFNFSDTDGHAFAGVVLTTAPSSGTVRANGSVVGSGGFITEAHITAGLVTYTPNANLSGVAFESFTFQVRDTGGTTPGQDTDQSANTFSFDVTAVNDAPTNTVPGTQSINEDATLTFAGANAITVSDVDLGAGDLKVTLSVQTGGLTLSGTSGLIFSIGDGTGDTTMTFTGVAADINAALNGLVYNPGTNYNGNRTLVVTTNDQGNSGADPGGADLTSEQDSDNILIQVTSINDAPVVINGTAVAAGTISEDTPLARTVDSLFAGHYSDVADAQFSGANPGGSSQGAFSGIAVVANGSSAGTGQWQYLNGASVWVDIGTVSSANALLIANTTQIRFNPAPNFNGAAPTLTAHLIDNSLGFGITYAQTADLSGPGATGGSTAYSGGAIVLSQEVTAVNDAPTVSIAAPGTATEQVALNLKGLASVADADSGTGNISVTLSVDFGIIHVESGDSGAGVTGNDAASVTISGSLAQVVAMLGSGGSSVISYIANSNTPASSATLTVSVNDNGNSGGAAQSASDSETFLINAVNDAPVLTAPTSATITFTEGDPSIALLQGVTLSDADAQGNFSGGSVSLGVSGGPGSGGVNLRAGSNFQIVDIGGGNFNIVYTPGGPITIGAITGYGTPTMAITGLTSDATLARLNDLIDDFVYVIVGENPTASARTVTLTVSDGGNSGAGGAQSHSVNQTLNVVAVNDAPVIAAPLARAGTEDVNLVFSVANGNPVSLADADATILSVTLSVLHGRLTLAGTAGLTFFAGSNGSGTMTFEGTAAAINVALDGLVYRGALNYEGSDTLSIGVDDKGATGTPGTQFDSHSVAITLADDGFINGTSSNDDLDGTGGSDIFLLHEGGNDHADGLAGNDGFYFGAALTAADSVDGGAGTRDQLGLQGNYGTPFIFNAGHFTGVEMLVLLSGADTRFGDNAGNFYDYNLKTIDANVPSGQQMIVSFNTLRVGEDVTFDGSAETDGSFLTYGGLGADVLTGGQQSDGFYFGADGRFGAGDIVNGLSGTLDQLGLQGDYSGARAVTFGSGQILNIDMLVLLTAGDNRFGGGSGDGYSYDVTMNDGNVAAGTRLTVSANTLRVDGTYDEHLTFDGSAETNGHFTIFAGAGSDTLTGGSGADELWGRGGADVLTGGVGADRFVYQTAAETAVGAADRILDFTAASDLIDLSRIDANSNVAGDQAFTWSIDGNFHNLAGELRSQFDAGNSWWVVQGDLDGDGTGDFSIFVTTVGNAPLVITDFVL